MLYRPFGTKSARITAFATYQAMAFIGNHIVKIGTDFNFNPWAEDMGMDDMTPSGGRLYRDRPEGRLHTDEFGCVWDRSDSLPYPVAYPLENVPATHRAGSTRTRCRTPITPAGLTRRPGGRPLPGEACSSAASWAWPFRAGSIRGMEQLMVDMVERPEFVDGLLHRILSE